MRGHDNLLDLSIFGIIDNRLSRGTLADNSLHGKAFIFEPIRYLFQVFLGLGF